MCGTFFNEPSSITHTSVTIYFRFKNPLTFYHIFTFWFFNNLQEKIIFFYHWLSQLSLSGPDIASLTLIVTSATGTHIMSHNLAIIVLLIPSYIFRKFNSYIRDVFSIFWLVSITFFNFICSKYSTLDLHFVQNYLLLFQSTLNILLYL